jgi:hypothetical protein
MENIYINATKRWSDLKDDMAVVSKVVSKKHLPIANLPALRFGLLSSIQKCLFHWEAVDDCVHPSVPADKKWAFDRIGNMLRETIIQLQKSDCTRNEWNELGTQLRKIEMLGHQVDEEFFWYTAQLIMPDSIYRSSELMDYRKNRLVIRKSKKWEEEMSSFIPKLRKALDIRKDNAAELEQHIASNPFEPSLKRRYEEEVTEYRRLAKQLRAQGENVDDKLFDEPPATNQPKKGSQNKLARTSKSSHKTQGASLHPVSNVSKPERESPDRRKVKSLRENLVEYSDLFKKNVAIDAYEPLKEAVEAKFEILLLHVNLTIDELEQKGEDAYDMLEVAKMLDLSIRRMRKPESAGKSKEILGFLGVAIDSIKA